MPFRFRSLISVGYYRYQPRKSVGGAQRWGWWDSVRKGRAQRGREIPKALGANFRFEAYSHLVQECIRHLVEVVKRVFTWFVTWF